MLKKSLEFRQHFSMDFQLFIDKNVDLKTLSRGFSPAFQPPNLIDFYNHKQKLLKAIKLINYSEI